MSAKELALFHLNDSLIDGIVDQTIFPQRNASWKLDG